MGRNQKRNKKAKIETGSRNSVAGLRSEQWQAGSKFRNLRNFVGSENSQPAKFCRLENFRNPIKFL